MAGVPEVGGLSYLGPVNPGPPKIRRDEEACRHNLKGIFKGEKNVKKLSKTCFSVPTVPYLTQNRALVSSVVDSDPY